MSETVKILAEWLPDERTAALVTSDLSLRHLCGFGLSRGLILASKEESFLFVSESELEPVKEKARGFSVRVYTDTKQLLDILIKHNIRRIFVESDKMTVREFNFYADGLHYAKLDTSDTLSQKLAMMRAVKSEAELNAVRRAQLVCDKAYDKLLMSVRKGMSERQTAAMLSSFLIENGADEIMPRMRIASGENSAKHYSKPTDRRLSDGDFLLVDFGAKAGGCWASMARTAVVGEISPKRENIYNAVLCAVTDGLKALRAGTGAKVAESVARATLNNWDIDRYAKADFGHGTGLEFSEPPYLAADSTSMLKAGMTLVCGCEVTAPSRYGVKIADCVCVTDEGYINLTSATKSLVHI
ncbi:MAG: aminopeptidase P family protein [Oscillospiraceae bacterium]|nr:aminopeptidase P family protein [Oscillospiraceae bacterium]